MPEIIPNPIVTSTSTPNPDAAPDTSVVGGRKAAAVDKRKNFLARGYDHIGHAATKHRVVATIGAVVTGGVLKDRAIDPLIDKAAGGIKRLVTKKAAAQVTEEARGAVMGAGLLGVLSSAIGSVVK